MKFPFLKKKKTIEMPEEIFEAPAIEAKDIIAPSSIEIKPDHIKLGERFVKSFFIFSYPRYLNAAWLSPIINLDQPMDISFHIHPIDTGTVLKQLRRKVTEVQAEIMEKEEKGLIRDPALETAYQDIESLRDRLQTAQEKMFKFGLYLTVYGNTLEQIKKVETTLRSILESRLIYVKPSLYQQREGFNSTSPYGLDQIQVHTSMNTEPLSSTFPFTSSDLSSNDGILYGINLHNNSLILFDRFSLENANSVIFAKSGSGKSILSSEPVLIRNKGEIQLTKIGPVIEKLIEERGAAQIDEELEGVINPGLQVYSFDKNLKGEWSNATVAARKKAPEVFYKFTTRSGREITTTGDHNMIILRNGAAVTAKSSEVKEGEFIPLPRSVSSDVKSPVSLNLLRLLRNSKYIYVEGAKDLIIENYKLLKSARISNQSNDYLTAYKRGVAIPIRFFWKILKRLRISLSDDRLKNLHLVHLHKERGGWFNIYFPINNDFLKIAGFITSEGYIHKKYIQISNIDREVLDSVRVSLKNLAIPFRELKSKKRQRIEGIEIKNRIFVEIVKALNGGGKSDRKRVWPFLFSLEKEKISKYLLAYFEGDGGVNVKDKAVVASSKSKRLILEMSYLFYYFGIIGRISKIRRKCPTTGWKRNLWILRISGQENLNKFAGNINFISQRKRRQLSKIIGKKSNTSVDFVPGLQPILKEIHQLFSPQLHNIRQFADWKNGKKRASPQELLKMINIIERKIQYFKDLGSTFKILNELPELATIINFGINNKELNRALWQTVGEGWRTIKSQEHKPFTQNTLKALQVINGDNYSLTEIKEIIHLGFRETDLPTKYYNRALEPRYLEKNTRYETIQKSARFVWQSYQEILINKIPQVEEKLAQLKTLANSDLFWDPIAKIKKIENKKEKYVYDLTVDNEVFLAGQGGMFVHNSYAVKLEILRSLMLGVETIIIDPENEYQPLTDAVDGSFFNMSLASPNHINPFDLPIPRKDEKPEDVLRSNILNLVGLLRIMLGGLSPEEDGIIDRALTETYAAKDITPETDPSAWEDKIPLMSDFEQVLEGMEGAESLVRRIRKFTKGTFAQFFNQPTNISMGKPFVAFGIRDMEDELRPMAMFVVMRYIWNKVRSEMKKRILVVDEAWWIMRTEDGASFLFGMCKRARKYWLGVTTITQDVNDFMKSEYGKPIITNSSLQFLMKQSPATIDTVQKTFNLTDEEKYLLLECEVGEGIFFAGQKHVSMKVVASYAEDQFITTSPEEILKIKKAKGELA